MSTVDGGVAFDLHEDHGRAPFDLVDLDGQALDALRLDPRARQRDGAVHVAVAFPVGIEEGRLVGDADVLLERGDDRELHVSSTSVRF